MINNGKDQEPKHKLIESISLTQKNINVLKNIHHFPNLWNISLRNCQFNEDQTTSELLKPLSAFAYLGTLDLSFTNITFEWLQKYIRPLSIQHLKLYGIPYFPFDNPQCRGFLIFCLPNVWMINDQFITFAERRFWHRYYSPSSDTTVSSTTENRHFNNTNINANTNNNLAGAGQYSIYIRKYYINPDSSYIPSEEQEEYEKLGDIESIKKEEYNKFYNNNINPLSYQKRLNDGIFKNFL
ncbi:hypothetical protein BCR32DRAFT_249224 [Anaeromyces robustus]|uniref:L domain-like protein n=1 Tax=Anaeromyces robustus TaxID=1754192 RepID=A0A1Y1WQM8_9FUNG|nr:hypothetical protein BCR32DRAFT_249224 [Anaeromyces robustus]|eukprot:ORX75843.1 hypothetical protein BCR32DRAFT_249224 [Anaeromyces robustus]